MEIWNLLLGGGTHWGLTLAFMLAAALVVIAGLKLGAYGDALGERTGLGGGIIGLVFLALVTSLPDLTVSISAAFSSSLEATGQSATEAIITLQKGADLAAGNLIGSNLFNLTILFTMDLAQGEGAMMFRLSRKHITTCAGGMLLAGLLIMGYALEKTGTIPDPRIPVLDCGMLMPLIFLGYIGTLWAARQIEEREHTLDHVDIAAEERTLENNLDKLPALLFYSTLILLCVIIVASGIWLSYLGDRMSLPTAAGGFGLNASFVGSIFLAIATSLPELVVSYSLVRLKAYDAAAANVLGSNIFNFAGLFLADCAMRGQSLLAAMSPSLVFSLGMVVVMTNIVIFGLLLRSRRSFMKVGYDVWLLMLIYILGNICLYYLG